MANKKEALVLTNLKSKLIRKKAELLLCQRYVIDAQIEYDEAVNHRLNILSDDFSHQSKDQRTNMVSELDNLVSNAKIALDEGKGSVKKVEHSVNVLKYNIMKFGGVDSNEPSGYTTPTKTSRAAEPKSGAQTPDNTERKPDISDAEYDEVQIKLEVLTKCLISVEGYCWSQDAGHVTIWCLPTAGRATITAIYTFPACSLALVRATVLSFLHHEENISEWAARLNEGSIDVLREYGESSTPEKYK